jgi:hypothetical protein
MWNVTLSAAHSLRWYSSGWNISGLFLSRSSLVPFYPEHQTSTGAHLASYSRDIVDPSSALIQLMHEADHSSVIAECNCSCATPVCLHGVHRDIFTLSIVLEEWLKYLHGRNSVPQKMSAVWSHGTVCHSAVLCCVKTQIVVVWWSVSNMETWKILCMWIFILCNAHLLCLSLAFSSDLALTTVACTHDRTSSSLCFLKFRGCDICDR